ncbi:MAG: TonB-dependent receptor domain-containing protein, partial [Asticcacaulis sp.]
GGFRLKTDRFTGVVAAYHVDFNNRILAVTRGASIVGNAAILSNVGDVKTIGLEAAGTLRLTDTLKLAAAYTYNDSKYQSDVVSSSGVVNTKDKTVVNTPKHLFNAELAYDDGKLFGTVSTNFTGVRYYTYTNNGGKVDSSLVSDLTVGYRFSGEILDKTSVQLNVTNLMDVDYISTVGSGGFTNSDTSGTTMTLLPGAPRQIFVTVRKQF